MTRLLCVITASAVLLCAPAAAAAVPHTVGPGETLWGIAAASNLTTRTLAAANGLPEDAHVVLGSTIQVPSVPEGIAALQKAGIVPGSGAGSAPAGAAAPAEPAAAATPAPAAPSASGTAPGADAPAPLGSYVVRKGDTLSGLAAVARVDLAAIAAMNGLNPDRPLLIGTVLKLPTGSAAPPAAAQPAPAQRVVPAAAPNPTPARVSAGDIQSIAGAHGVPGSLAAAIAWQESGFNNAMVSSANARGVMQVMPGTWQHVEETMARRKLDPSSATDNIHAGVLYLKHLLQQTGGDEAGAVAAYYQGLGALRSRGMFEDTKRYVANVQALKSRFGG